MRSTMKEEKLSIQASIVWNTLGSSVYMATQWLITILVVRLADVAAAGDLALAMSVNNIFYSIAVFGIRNYQVSDVKNKYSNGIYITSRIISCVGSLLLGILYCLPISYTVEQKVCIILYCIFKMSEALYDVYAGICQKAWRMDYIGKSWLLRGITTFVAFCAVLYVTADLLPAVLAMAIISFVIIGVYDIPKTRGIADIRIQWESKECLRLMKECAPLLCYLILSTTVTTIPRVLMERMLGNYALGIYGSVAAPTVIVQMGASYIFNPFMTVFAEQYASGRMEAFWGTLKKCGLGILVLGAIALVGGRLLGAWGLKLLYGAEVASYVSLLLPLIGSTILTACVWLMCGLLTVVRAFKGLIYSNIIAVIVSGVSSVICIKYLDMQGATVALIAGLITELLCLFTFLVIKIHKTNEEVE